MSTKVLAPIGIAALIWSATGYAQDAGEHHHHTPAQATLNSPPESENGNDGNPTQSEQEHVPPDPPANEIHDMPYERMAKMMAMDDTGSYGKLLFDQLDWRDTQVGNALAWDVEGFYGNDYNKLWLRTEGERIDGRTEDARVEVLWDRIVSRWWSTQAGVRHDFGPGPSRDWIAVGIQGMAPYFFDIEATAYVGDSGRTAARLKAEYELLFSQRLILQPEVELNVYGKDDPGKGVMAGFSDAQIGLRLRYEIRREVAPYIGVAWVRRLGKTADLVRASGEGASDFQALAGIRFWF